MRKPRSNSAEHQRKRRHDERRGSSTARGYDRQWRKLRAAKLAADPLCECDQCQGGNKQTRLASVVNHKLEIADHPELRLEWSNLQSMAKECHDRHTALTRGFAKTTAPKQYFEDVGADGMPTDPDHPWRQEG